MKKSLYIECFKCKRPITKFGALLFAPPICEPVNRQFFDVMKIHICKKCFKKVFEFIRS